MGSIMRWDPTRWNPIRELEQVSERFNHVFGGLSTRRRENASEALTVADWG
jgi:hypothetical protein